MYCGLYRRFLVYHHLLPALGFLGDAIVPQEGFPSNPGDIVMAAVVMVAVFEDDAGKLFWFGDEVTGELVALTGVRHRMYLELKKAVMVPVG